jgi:hypothetical protein
MAKRRAPRAAKAGVTSSEVAPAVAAPPVVAASEDTAPITELMDRTEEPSAGSAAAAAAALDLPTGNAPAGDDGDAPAATEEAPRSETPGARRAREWREKQKQARGGDAPAPRARRASGGRKSRADLEEELEEARARLAMQDTAPADLEALGAAVRGSFHVIGLVASRMAPELAVTDADVAFLEKIWVPALAPYAGDWAKYLPLVAAGGATAAVFIPKWQRYEKRTKAEKEARGEFAQEDTSAEVTPAAPGVVAQRGVVDRIDG